MSKTSTLVRRVVGVCALAAAAGVMTGASALCGCPSNCSPLVCVDINWTCPPQQLPGACEFRTSCNHLNFTSPGDRWVTGTGPMEPRWCRIQRGISGPTGCVYNPGGEIVGWEEVLVITSVTSIPCDGGNPIDE